MFHGLMNNQVYSTTSQMTIIFIVAAMRISNVMFITLFITADKVLSKKTYKSEALYNLLEHASFQR